VGHVIQVVTSMVVVWNDNSARTVNESPDFGKDKDRIYIYLLILQAGCFWLLLTFFGDIKARNEDVQVNKEKK
jgi:hypothetical protein